MGRMASEANKAQTFPERAHAGYANPFRLRRRLVLFAAAAALAACATSPTGRDQLILFPDDQVAQMGVTAYQELKNSTPVTRDSSASRYVSCVANALTGALPEGSAIQPAQWEVTVFADDQINAFALPGGKIGVYQGLLAVAENQDQLATVVAHEIAHVLSRHSNERISTQYATSTGLELASVLAGQTTPAKQTLFGLLGKRGGYRGSGVDGEGRFRSAAKRRPLAEHERGWRRRAAGIPFDASFR
jgi:predicted Zn-dependent protease